MKKNIAILLVFLMLSGCGYKFYGGGDSIDKNIVTVFVTNFVNTSSEANVETAMRNSMVDAIIKDSRFKVVDSATNADAVISGNIKSISISTLSVGYGNVAKQARVAIVMDMNFVARQTGKSIWEIKNYSTTGDYNITDTTVTDSQKQETIRGITRDASDRLYSLMLSGF